MLLSVPNDHSRSMQVHAWTSKGCSKYILTSDLDGLDWPLDETFDEPDWGVPQLCAGARHFLGMCVPICTHWHFYECNGIQSNGFQCNARCGLSSAVGLLDAKSWPQLWLEWPGCDFHGLNVELSRHNTAVVGQYIQCSWANCNDFWVVWKVAGDMYQTCIHVFMIQSLLAINQFCMFLFST